MLQTMTDKKLLTDADAQEAFKVIYNRYWEQLYKKAFYLFKNSQSLQDYFIIIMNNVK